MKHLYHEVLRRFPEIEPWIFHGDEELPYVFVSYIAEWLKTSAKLSFSSATIKRIVEFDRWCMTQPRGTSADDDIMTIYTVAFREKIFEHDSLLPLIRHIMDRKDLLRNKDYLINWVGADRYEAALHLFETSKKEA